MQTTNRAVLNFETMGTGIVRLSIPRANAAATPEVVHGAMLVMIDSNAIEHDPNGRPVDMNSAFLISTERVRLV